MSFKRVYGTDDGVCILPYVVYKGGALEDTWAEGGPLGTRYIDIRTKSS